MAETEFDNRLRFPPTEIDFDNDVGITGQDHDNYPAPGQQPRYDWLRMTLIGLLSLQSSATAPLQYRTGTPWYDRSTNTIKIWSGSAWEPISKYINVSDDSDPVSLYNELISINERINSVFPTATFTGYCAKSTDRIKVPDAINSLLASVYSSMRPLVYKNGLLIDPRRCSLSPACPLYVVLLDNLIVGDTFTVVIQHFDSFITDNVIAS